jgi:hypothetical protein
MNSQNGNFGMKLNLSMLKGASVADIQFPHGVERCVVIPVAPNNLFEGQKGVYLDLVGIAMQSPKFDATHVIKQSLPKSVRERMTEEERRSQPILGDLKPLGSSSQPQPAPNAYGTGAKATLSMLPPTASPASATLPDIPLPF